MMVCSVQIISRLDSQSTFYMFILFSSHHVEALLVYHRGTYTNKGTPYWALSGSVNLCKTFRRIHVSEFHKNAKT